MLHINSLLDKTSLSLLKLHIITIAHIDHCTSDHRSTSRAHNIGYHCTWLYCVVHEWISIKTHMLHCSKLFTMLQPSGIAIKWWHKPRCLKSSLWPATNGLKLIPRTATSICLNTAAQLVKNLISIFTSICCTRGWYYLQGHAALQGYSCFIVHSIGHHYKTLGHHSLCQVKVKLLCHN